MKKAVVSFLALILMLGVIPMTASANAQGPFTATVGDGRDDIDEIHVTLSITGVEQKMEPNAPQADSAKVNWAIKVSGETVTLAGEYNYKITANGREWATGSFEVKEDFDYTKMKPLTGYGSITENTVFDLQVSVTVMTEHYEGDEFLLMVRYLPIGDAVYPKRGRSGGGRHAVGEVVELDAGRRAGYTFDRWVSDDPEVAIADPSSIETTFVMPAHDVTLTSMWTEGGPGNPEAGVYFVRFTDTGKGAKGGGFYEPGDTVTIYAGNSTPNVDYSMGMQLDGLPKERQFLNWIVAEDDVKLANPTAVTTTFIMPAHPVNLTGNWKVLSYY